MPDESDRLMRSESGFVERQRATPLKPAIWMTGVLVWATVVGLFLRVPTWAGVFLCCMTGVSFLFYLVFYIYLMVADPDALRSERYREPRVSPKRSVERARIGALEGYSRTTLESAGQLSESTERVPALDGAAGLSVEGPGGGGRARVLQGGEGEPSHARERAT